MYNEWAYISLSKHACGGLPFEFQFQKGRFFMEQDNQLSQTKTINEEKSFTLINSQNQQESADEDTKEKTKENFIKDNATILSSCEWLRQLEKNFKQTIEISPSEKENPNCIIEHLEYLKKNYGLHLDKGSSSNFFVPTQSDEQSFEEILTGKFGNQIFHKAITRCYHYLVLLNRKSMHFTFKDLSRTYNFDLKDIYHCDGINAMGFNSINDVPNNIVKRCKVSYENYQFKTRSFVRKLISYSNQIYSKQVQMQNVAQSDDGDNDKKQQQINSINNEIKAIERKVEKLSFEIEEELYITPRTETPTPNEVVQFISDFICYGLQVTSDVIRNKSANQIHDNDDVLYTTHTDIIRSLETDSLFFQDTVNLVWVSAKDLIHTYVTNLAPTLKLNKDSQDNLLNSLTTDIKSKPKVSVFSFKENTLFFKNGMIEIEYKEDGTLNYQFTHNKLINRRALMFTHATKLRLDILYNDDVDYTFKDNPINEPVTPDYIFGALGRRGFETNDDMNEETKNELDNEAKSRANLLMQYSLNILLPYNEVQALSYGYFLYFYNSEHSGKSTFMELMNNIVGNKLTVNLNTKDLSSQESFGLVNTKNKRLVLIDEATNGKHKIDTENIKKMTTKSQVNVNAKNKDYENFKFENELILASNYEPTFLDESGGTERRLLAFQLETGYKDNGGKSGLKPLSFIQDDLIKRNDFKSACVKWILNNVNATQTIPNSIKEDANRLISKEDDVRAFIDEKLRQTIDEPVIIYPEHLYELYKIENISKGRNITKIRNKQNFTKALDKMTKGVHLIKEATHSKLDTLNRLIALEGMLFSEIHQAQNNTQLDNTLIKHFMDIMQERKNELKSFYNSIPLVQNKTLKLSNLTVSKRKVYAILPDLPQYESTPTNEELRKIATQNKQKMLKSALTDENIEHIKHENYGHLPTPINITMNSKFYSYTNDLDIEKTNFNDFLKYD